MSDRPRWPWITLITLQVIQLLTLVPWLVVAGFSVMAFDSPGSSKMWEPWALVLTIWSYPVWLVFAAVGSWVLYRFRRYRTAVGLALVFTLPMPALMFLVMVAGSFA